MGLVPAAGLEHAVAMTAGGVAGVEVSRDARHIRIRCDGPVATPRAFVIGNPNRLVIDFKETGLRDVPRRIRVDKYPVQEIRLGYSNARARVVVDFGETPVPAHRLHNEGNDLLLVLGKPQTVPVGSVRKRNRGNVWRKSTRSKSRPKARRSVEKQKSNLSIRSAVVKDDLIVLEVSDRKRPERRCRLVLELDMNRLQVSRATFSDDKGQLRSCNLSEGKARGKISETTVGSTSRAGKETSLFRNEKGRDATYKWGVPKIKRRGPTSRGNLGGPPVRVERFVPRKRDSKQQS